MLCHVTLCCAVIGYLVCCCARVVKLNLQKQDNLTVNSETAHFIDKQNYQDNFVLYAIMKYWSNMLEPSISNYE